MTAQALRQFYHRRAVLVTGGLGFIGSSLALELVKLRARVTIVDALTPGLGGNRFNIEPVKSHIAVHVGNLGRLDHLRACLKNQALIFNLAGTHSHIDSMRHPTRDLTRTCAVQLRFLQACRRLNPSVKIVMAGTRNQYGKPHYLPIDEAHPLEPLDINGAHWLAVENYHRLYYRVYGLRTCSLRLTNTYGPRHQMRHPYQGILNWFIRRALDGQPIVLYGDGGQKRDATFIDDVVSAFLWVGASETVWGQAFNVGGKSIVLRDFAKQIITIVGEGKIIYRPFPPEPKRIEPGDVYLDWRKIKKTLGWKPSVSLEEGIKMTINFYQKFRQYYW